jgi:hypothetical protein
VATARPPATRITTASQSRPDAPADQAHTRVLGIAELAAHAMPQVLRTIVAFAHPLSCLEVNDRRAHPQRTGEDAGLAAKVAAAPAMVNGHLAESNMDGDR